jgi:5-methylcytosine-specific restriction endonuclease McrA
MPRRGRRNNHDAARSPSGEVWWKLTHWPGKTTRFGVEPKLAAWLNFNAKVGDVFTMRQLREVLGDMAGRPNAQEHFNRRFRALRKYGWIVLSSRDAGDLKSDEYRLEQVGSPIWLGKSKYGSKGISDKTRHQIFARDGNRCVLCGIGSGEPYPDQPGRKARLTLGHFVADSLRGPTDPANLRTECSRCNEPVKEEAQRSESAAELWPRIRNLSRVEKARLFAWIEKGYRQRDAIDTLFDQVRVLPAAQRDQIRARLKQSLEG